MSWLRARFTYANVLSTLAIFIVLGGGAYAATKLPKNSVGTKQLKDRSVTKAKLAKGLSTQGPRGADGATGDTGPAGPQGVKGNSGLNGNDGLKGDKGDDGDQGDRGPSDATVVTGNSDMDLTNDIVASYILPTGKFVASAKVTLINTGAALATANCVLELSGPTVLDTSTVKIPGSAGANQTEINLIAAVPSGSNFLLVVCDDGGGTVAATETKMSVITVANLL